MSVTVQKMYDLAIVGSGFGGSLLAMIARRLGRSVVLVERGRHPRFTIGESSTPLANLALEDLCGRYDLPQLLPLTKWSTWQAAQPQLACGLKRGFTFYRHTSGQPWTPTPGRDHELLVAASPNDRLADTHWYRPHFDQFLVEQAQAMGVDYIDEFVTESWEPNSSDSPARILTGHRHGRCQSVHARWFVDASGPRGWLHHQHRWTEIPRMPHLGTQALFTHFRHVRRWSEVVQMASDPPPPYAPDDAAVHHLVDGGWVWVLRFNHGVTSAGIAATAGLAQALQLSEGAPAWQRLLQRYPTLAATFADAEVVHPFLWQASLPYRAPCLAGPRWVLLPSAAGFVDPLLSTGFPLTLLGIERLGRWLEQRGDAGDAIDPDYVRHTTDELDTVERLISALYSVIDTFPVFRDLARLYFAAASFSEVERRLRRAPATRRFLLQDDARFASGLRACCQFVEQTAAARGWTAEALAAVHHQVNRVIEPFDIAGLNRTDRRYWYPVEIDDTLAAAAKLGVDRESLRGQLERIMAGEVVSA